MWSMMIIGMQGVKVRKGVFKKKMSSDFFVGTNKLILD
jgi:hypothetical protein